MTRLALLVLAVLLATAAPAVAQSTRPPTVSAPAAIVVEATTGAVAYAKDPAAERSPASTTKLMTALLAVEGAALDDVLTVPPYDASPAESLAGLRPGERISVRDLLRGLMLASGNDAAVTLATGISGSRSAFVREMNARARELGLRDTSFTNPIGLDEGRNRSSPRDLARLTRVLRRNEFLRRTADQPRATITSGGRRLTVVNRNTLLRRVAWVDGFKTGRTNQAGYVLVGSGTRRGVTVVSTVMGSPTESQRDADTLALLRYALGRFQRRTVVRRGATLARADLRFRDEQVRLVAGRGIQRVLRNGQRARVRLVGAPAELDGPLTAGARVGTVEARVAGRVVARAPLVTATAVEEAGLATRLSHLLSRPTTLLLVLLALACTVSLVLLRRRVVRRGGIRA
jgi:serine-type D-Ala-D-Ala carboxypeptidase (penicillin-binding protein 5/6)